MSWIERLYQTYESNKTAIGDPGEEMPLLPICHTTQKAHVTIVIDGNGNFLRASVVPKTEARTIIPATEDSAGRTSGTTPHPLCDKLQYVAGDYARFGGEKEPCHEDYLALLKRWKDMDGGQAKLSAVFAYVSKGAVAADLVKGGVLHADATSSRLINEWPDKKSAPEIFRLLAGGYDAKGKSKPWQADAFVRWSVETPGDPQPEVWLDRGLWESWERYYGSLKSLQGLCFVTGAVADLAKQHPAKIRNDGDKAKLISSNDISGFTFRGRFADAEEACGVGFRVTQEAHSALRWLIARQGRRDGDQAVVAWAVSGVEIPDPMADSFSLLFGGPAEEVNGGGYTAQEVSLALSAKIGGYSARLAHTDDVVVMALDSATPGRMAIRYYRELTGSEFLARIENWHRGCCWRQHFGKDRIFFGAPAPRDIAETAYGTWRDGKVHIDDKIMKATVERLLPCIVDGAALPRDLVDSCVRRASSRNGIEPWGWEKTLGIACALFRYQYKERNYAMALERDRNTRDYLYGRLLALAEHMESRALYVGGEQRATNAEKLMQRFADRPYSTWLTLETGLTPYRVRLRAKRPGFLHRLETEIDEVVSVFDGDDFTSDKRLTGEFLLGYHCQREALRPVSAKEGEQEAGEVGETDTDNEE
ncbi:MAG: type I-C CRISPR-associated protein Cas8c/Csd1 [Thermodesulfobacteriota bacterium]